MVSDIDTGRRVDSQGDAVVGRGESISDNCIVPWWGIWPVTTAKIDGNVLCLQIEEGLALPCSGKQRRAKCRRHSVAGKLGLQA